MKPSIILMSLLLTFMGFSLLPQTVRAEYGYPYKPQFSGCFESYIDNLVQQASAYGSAYGEHMGYWIAMVKYLPPQVQACMIDVAIYSADKILVDRRFVACQ